MPKLTYMPTADDADETVVSEVNFKAYEPTEIPEDKAHLVKRLAGNPWFSDGAVDDARKAAWQRVRDAAKAAEQAVTAHKDSIASARKDG